MKEGEAEAALFSLLVIELALWIPDSGGLREAQPGIVCERTGPDNAGRRQLSIGTNDRDLQR